MKQRNWTIARVAVVLLLVGYALAAWWLFVHNPATRSDGRVKVRISHWQIESGPPEGIEAVIKRYEELNPHVDVEQVMVPSNLYKQWLRTNLVGGTGADIIEFGITTPGMQDVPARFFTPITAELEEPNPYNRGTPLEGVPWRNTFIDGLFNEQSNSPEIGQIYSVTMAQFTLRMFCNEDLLREITGHDPNFKFPETFDEFRRLFVLTQEFSRRTGRKVHVIAGARVYAEHAFATILSFALLDLNMKLDQEGQLVRHNRNVQMDYLRGKWNYRMPEVQAGLELGRELLAQMRPGVLQLERGAEVQEFMQGEALFVVTGTWDGTSLRRVANFPVGIYRLPQPDANDPVTGRYYYGRAADGSGLTDMALYLNNRSPHRAEAIDFLRFLTSVEGGQLFMERSGWISSVRETKIPEDLKPAYGVPDGYIAGAGYFRTNANTASAFISNMYRLAGPQGSVAQFVEAVEPEMPAAQRADLQIEVRNLTHVLRQQDAELLAVRALDRLAAVGDAAARRQRIELLETSQTFSEINLCQAAAVLRLTPPPG